MTIMFFLLVIVYWGMIKSKCMEKSRMAKKIPCAKISLNKEGKVN